MNSVFYNEVIQANCEFITTSCEGQAVLSIQLSQFTFPDCTFPKDAFICESKQHIGCRRLPISLHFRAAAVSIQSAATATAFAGL